MLLEEGLHFCVGEATFPARKARGRFGRTPREREETACILRDVLRRRERKEGRSGGGWRREREEEVQGGARDKMLGERRKEEGEETESECVYLLPLRRNS